MNDSKPIWKALRYGILVAAIVGAAVTRTQSIKFWLIVIVLLGAVSSAEIIVSTKHGNKASKLTPFSAKHIGLTIFYWFAVIIVSILIFVFTEKWRHTYR